MIVSHNSIPKIRNFVRKFLILVNVFLLATLLNLLLIRFIWGPGQNNPIYGVTGIYIGKIIYFNLYLIGFTSLTNKEFLKFLRKIFSSSKHLGVTNSLEFRVNSWIISCFISFFSFVITTALYFRNKSNNVFIGVDGDYLRSVNSNQVSWGGRFFDLGVNPLQGLGGNIWFPLNTRSDPGYILGRLPENFDWMLAHIGWATLLYLSTFFLATRLRLTKEVVILSAWVVPFFIIFPSVLQFSTVPQLIPHMSTVIALNTILLAILITNQNTNRVSVFSGLLFTICFLSILVINPTFLILCIPLNLFIFLISLKVHFARGLTTRYLLTFGIPLGLLSLPTASYLLGIIKFTAVGMFSDQFIVGAKSNRAISSIFQLPGTAMTIAVSLIGMLLVIRIHKNETFVRLAKSTFTLFCLIMTFGLFYVRNPEIWDGPSPNYFEFMAWPIYGIFFSFIIIVLFSSAISHFKKHLHFFNRVNELNLLISTIVVFALVASFITIPAQKYWEFPAKENKILSKLGTLAISPGSEFNGRQMTFTGLNLSEGISWNELQKNDYVPIISEFGSDFRKADLWIRSIPTLTEYSQAISPISYKLLLALLGRKDDKQVRNMMTLRRVNSPALAMLGVALIVTDRRIIDLELLETLESNSNSVFLYRIAEPNLGGYSPIQVIKNKSNSYILERMTKMDFDPKKTVFVSEGLDLSNLHKAFETELKVLRNGYRVKASSIGKSIVVLPIEFSSCWSMASNNPSEDTPKLFRANYGLTGLLFNNSMNVDLVYRYNFFGSQSCRLADLAKVK